MRAAVDTSKSRGALADGQAAESDAEAHAGVLPRPAAAGSVRPSLVERVRRALWISVGGNIVLVLAGARLDRGARTMQAVQLLVFATAGAGFAALHRRSNDRIATAAALGLSGVGFFAATVHGTLADNPLVTPLVCGGATLVAAAFLPWSASAQLVMVGLGAIAGAANVLLAGPEVGSASLAMVGCFGLSIYFANVLGRARQRTVEIEATWRESEQRFRQLSDNASEIFWLMDVAPPRIIYLSPAYERIWGQRSDRVRADPLQILNSIHSDDQVRMREFFRTLVAGDDPRGRVAEAECRVARPDGLVRWLRVAAYSVPDASGRPARVGGLAEDVTERKRTEEALRESEALLRSVLESAHDYILQLAPDGTIRFFNRPYGTLTPERVVGTSVYEWLPPETHALVRARLRKVVESGEPDGFDIPTLVLGEPVWFRTRMAPVTRDGQVVALTLVAANITEERRADTVQDEEAQVAAALARVGQALIASLDTPVLLQRLCELTTEVFGCETSHTFVPVEDGFAVAAGYGDSAEQWDSLRAIQLPHALVAPILDRLAREGVVQVVLDEVGDELPTAALSRRYGVTLAVYFPFRKGEEIVGVQSAAFRGRRTPLGPLQLRLAAGIADLASLALETARLVEALEAADRSKTEFLANMSHELRTPLNVIIGYNEMLLDGACGRLADEQRLMVERVHRNARELLTLVTTALEISRYEARGIALEIEEVSVPALIDDLARETGALPEKPGLALRWHVAPDLPHLRTDLLKLKMVLKNLVDNGIKFTARGHLAVEATTRDGGVEFRVADTGIGIPANALDEIFEPFRQGEHTQHGQSGGVGLGLYLVRRLLDALGGDIRVESAVGTGSIFSVWIPCDRAAPPPQSH